LLLTIVYIPQGADPVPRLVGGRWG
jgi:hypothetical protein